MTPTLVDRRAARAMVLATDDFDAAAMAELHNFAATTGHWSARSVSAWRSPPASAHATALLGRVRDEDLPPSA